MKEDENVGGLSPLLMSPLPPSPPPSPILSPSTPSIGITLEEFARLMQIQQLLNEPSFIDKANNSDNDSQLDVDAQGMKRGQNKYHAEEEIDLEDSQNGNTGSSPNRLFSLSPPQIVVYSEDLEIVERSITNIINKEKNKENEVKKNKERERYDGLEEEYEYSEDEMGDESPSSIQFESPKIFCNEEHDFFEDIWYTSAIEENLRQLQSEQGVFPPFIYPNYNFPSLPNISPPSPYNRSFVSYAPVPQFVVDQINARPQPSPIAFVERFEEGEEEVKTPFHIADIMCDFITKRDCGNDECERQQKKEPPEKRKSNMSKSQSAPNISKDKNEESESPHLLCKRIRLDSTEQPPNHLTFWNMDSSSSLLAEMLDCAIPPTESFFPAIPNYTRYIKPFQK